MHTVGAAFQPIEETADAIPLGFPGAPAVLPVGRARNNPFPLGIVQLRPGYVQPYPGRRRMALQVVLALFIGGRLKRTDRAVAQAFAFVRDDETVVDTHDTAKAATTVAGAQR